MSDLSWKWIDYINQRSEAARRLLPVGSVVGCRFRFDDALWGQPAALESQYVIGETTGIPKFRRYIYFDALSESILFQLTPGENESVVVNSLPATLVSSIGLWRAWFGAITNSKGEDESALRRLSDDAIRQFDAIESVNGRSDSLPTFWPQKVSSLIDMI